MSDAEETQRAWATWQLGATALLSAALGLAGGGAAGTSMGHSETTTALSSVATKAELQEVRARQQKLSDDVQGVRAAQAKLGAEIGALVKVSEAGFEALEGQISALGATVEASRRRSEGSFTRRDAELLEGRIQEQLRQREERFRGRDEELDERLRQLERK